MQTEISKASQMAMQNGNVAKFRISVILLTNNSKRVANHQSVYHCHLCNCWDFSSDSLYRSMLFYAYF